MSGNSQVGNATVYEAGDQRNSKNPENQNKVPYEEGKENSHNNLDSKDQRSIANRLAAAERQDEQPDSAEVAQLKVDPTLPAKMHGNEPSRGAKIDAEIKAEEEETLRQKGKA